MIRLATMSFQCLVCGKDSPKFHDKDLMESVRVMEEIHGWSMTQQEDQFYLRCPECTAELDIIQESLLGI